MRREAFLENYIEHVEPTCSSGEAAIGNLLSIYELEKAIYGLATSSTTGPTGSQSRWPGSGACWRPNE